MKNYQVRSLHVKSLSEFRWKDSDETSVKIGMQGVFEEPFQFLFGGKDNLIIYDFEDAWNRLQNGERIRTSTGFYFRVLETEEKNVRET